MLEWLINFDWNSVAMFALIRLILLVIILAVVTLFVRPDLLERFGIELPQTEVTEEALPAESVAPEAPAVTLDEVVTPAPTDSVVENTLPSTESSASEVEFAVPATENPLASVETERLEAPAAAPEALTPDAATSTPAVEMSVETISTTETGPNAADIPTTTPIDVTVSDRASAVMTETSETLPSQPQEISPAIEPQAVPESQSAEIPEEITPPAKAIDAQSVTNESGLTSEVSEQIEKTLEQVRETFGK